MSEKKAKRKWFQLHLSTCVVLMILLGAYLGLQFGEPKILSRPRQSMPGTVEFRLVTVKGPGWPFFFERSHEFIERKEGEAVKKATEYWIEDYTVYLPIYFNILIALALFPIITIASEYFIRRRQRKQQAAQQ